MKYFAHIAALASLGCCLSAAPALAELSTPDPGAAQTLAETLDGIPVLDALVTEMLPVSDSSLMAAMTKAVAPMGEYYTQLGVDSSAGAPPISASAASDSSGANAATALSSSLVQLAAGTTGATGAAIYVGSGTVVTTAELQGSVSTSSAPALAETITPSDLPQAPVPLPPAVFLMGTGLLGLLPLRRALGQVA